MLKKLRERLTGDYISEPRHDIVIYDILLRDELIPVTVALGLIVLCAVLAIRAYHGINLFTATTAIYLVFLMLLYILHRIFPGHYIFRSVIFTAIIAAMLENITLADPGFGEYIVLFVFPVITYNLAGKKTGIVWNGIFFICLIIVISLAGAGLVRTAYPVTSLLMAFLLFVNLAIFSHYAEIRHASIEKLLLRQLYYDQSSGLPNRKMLMEDLDLIIFPVIFILRIDNFHEINTFFGYTLGDTLMKFIGGRLHSFEETHNIRPYNLTAGDFALIPHMTGSDHISSEELSSTAVRILKHITGEEFVHGNNRIPLIAYIGIAPYTSETEHLISRADIALHHAISMNLPFHIYTEHDSDRVNYLQNIKILSELNSAITENRVQPYFQPILDNKTGAIDKHESLMRIISTDGMPRSPEQFLRVARKTRTYHDLTRIMIEKVFAYMENDSRSFSINISASDIYSPEFSGYLAMMMEKHPVNSGRVILEIVESEGFGSYNAVSDFIRSARDMGYRFAINDFGSGYSNFSYLSKLNIDYIKFDGSLINRLDSDTASMVIVRNIAGLCRELGIKTIAEFVENEEIFNRVKEFGIDYSQGFYIGLPGPGTHGA